MAPLSTIDLFASAAGVCALAVAAGVASGSDDPPIFSEEDRSWWAVQPLSDPAAPEGEGAGWARNAIDHFVARKLGEGGLEPAGEAGRPELVRRAYFDLHGLPPTPDEVEAFVGDAAPGAWERLVDRLLESPRYGERWGQHWLDLVRFAESDGYRQDEFRPGARFYRDYVVRSFNEDKPYDQFVREQLAGDEIAPDDPEVTVATGFLRHGIYEYNQRNARMHWELIMNELTNVTGEVFLGLGVGCAQCHDHKFDPILQKDYYALQAFLSSVSWPDGRALASPDEKARHAEALAAWEEATREVRGAIDALVADAVAGKAEFALSQFPDDVQAIYRKPAAERTPYEQQLTDLVERQVVWAKEQYDPAKNLKDEDKKRYLALKEELDSFEGLKPAPLPPAFVATDVGPVPAKTFVPVGKEKIEVEPAILTVLGGTAVQANRTATTTGRRLALAEWIVDGENPLATRVIVNRIWQHHFGTGLVPTPNDFGTLGDEPSHPELLDWLARRFLADGRRMKAMHRLVMTSAAYRQTARREPGDAESTRDPANRLLWRFPPRRLAAEEVRDAMLAVSGELEHLEDGGPSVDGSSPHRSIYVKRIRNTPDPLLKSFDAPSGFDSAAERIATTTPTQSLLLANGEWALKRAEAFARRVLGGATEAGPEAVESAYQLAFGRAPSDEETRAALDFVAAQLPEVRAATPAAGPRFPNETGLRPVTQAFGAAQGVELGGSALWLQPGSRFERLVGGELSVEESDFTVETVVTLDNVHKDASVNTLVSQWDGDGNSPGWSFGVTSEKSKYLPQNLIVQLVGVNFQGDTIYEVVASDLHVPTGKPVYLAAAVTRRPAPDDETSATVTFFMRELDRPEAPMQTRVVTHSVVGPGAPAVAPLVVGGRDHPEKHLWDGQMARLVVSRGALGSDKLVVGGGVAGGESPVPDRVCDWNFSGGEGEEPAPGTAWRRPDPPADAGEDTAPVVGAMSDFCHALINANEFLYLH